MAISWITALNSVPWTEVIGHAPKIVSGAKQLWSSVRKPFSSADHSEAGDASQLPAAELRIASLEQAIETTRAQLEASVSLINALAEQNAVLVERIEVMRQRQKWSLILVSIAGALSMISIALVVR